MATENIDALTKNTSGVVGATVKDALNTLNEASGVLTLFSESSEITLVQAGSVSFTHGLGTIPLLVQAHIICKAADAGYSIGNIVLLNGSYHDTSSTNGERGIILFPNSTIIGGRFGNDALFMRIFNKTTGTRATIVLASWKLVLRGWA